MYNVCDAGPTLYKCCRNVLCLLGKFCYTWLLILYVFWQVRFDKLFTCLSVGIMLKVFASILLERRIIFRAQHLRYSVFVVSGYLAYILTGISYSRKDRCIYKMYTWLPILLYMYIPVSSLVTFIDWLTNCIIHHNRCHNLWCCGLSFNILYSLGNWWN